LLYIDNLTFKKGELDYCWGGNDFRAPWARHRSIAARRRVAIGKERT
jgi:hypothetical protein